MKKISKATLVKIGIVAAILFLAPILLRAGILLLTTNARAAQVETFEVEAVDGEYATLRSKWDEDSVAPVRLLGVEISDEDSVADMLIGKTVKLMFDDSLSEKDDDGYLQAYLITVKGNENLNIQIIAAGFGDMTLEPGASMWHDFYMAQVTR